MTSMLADIVSAALKTTAYNLCISKLDAKFVRVTGGRIPTTELFDAQGQPISGCKFEFFSPNAVNPGRYEVRSGGSLEPAAGGSLDAVAAPMLTGFRFVHEALDTSFTAEIEPMPFGEFMSIITDSAGFYQRFVALFDDDTRARGGPDNDRIEVGAGDDTVTGGAGFDTVFKWKAGDLTFNGGRDVDVVRFDGEGNSTPFPTPFVQRLVLDLETGEGKNPYGGELHLTGVEQVVLPSSPNRVTGSAADEQVRNDYGGRRDNIALAGGDDTFDYSFGTLVDAKIDGGGGRDTLIHGLRRAEFPTLTVLDLADQTNSTRSFDGARITRVETFEITSTDTGTDLRFVGGNGGETLEFATGVGSGGIVDAAMGLGDDCATGGWFADRLDGGGGADTLAGGAGQDVITGGPGADLLTGDNEFSAAADRYLFHRGFGADTITDFDPAADLLDFSEHDRVDNLVDLTLTRVGADTLVEDGRGGSILVLGLLPRDVDDAIVF